MAKQTRSRRASERHHLTQIPLSLQPDRHAVLATFVVGHNAAAVTRVTAVAAGDVDEALWLHGPPGCGKTHLLQAACRHGGDAGRRAMFVSLEPQVGAHPDQLLGVEGLDLVAIDALDRVAGDPDWEARLFTVFNRFAGSPGGLLLAATGAPAGTPFALPDLASRAAGALVFRLRPLDENGQIEALCLHASQRGLDLDEATARFLLHRVPRGMAELRGWLDRLDEASLAAQRRLTIPFVRELLARSVAE
jgi:DnaA-homolog protein